MDTEVTLVTPNRRDTTKGPEPFQVKDGIASSLSLHDELMLVVVRRHTLSANDT